MHTCHLQLIIHVDIKLATKACPLNGGGVQLTLKSLLLPIMGYITVLTAVHQMV